MPQAFHLASVWQLLTVKQSHLLIRDGRVLEERCVHFFGSQDAASPLLSMTIDERMVADFLITGFTVGPHPMAYHRAAMNDAGVLSAADLKEVPDGTFVRVTGAVIARQRPGTASGFIFISGEDEPASQTSSFIQRSMRRTGWL